MIELILTVCALNAPSQCEEQRLQFVSQGSLMQCMMQAPPYIAAWSDAASGDARRAMAMRLPRRSAARRSDDSAFPAVASEATRLSASQRKRAIANAIG